MKTIKNTETSLALPAYDPEKGMIEKPVPVKYWDLIWGAVKRDRTQQTQQGPMPRGFSWDEIEKINRVKKYHTTIDGKVNAAVDVETQDYEFIMECIRDNSWNTFDNNLIEFKKYLTNLPDTPTKTKK